jgi:hypothetical protein
MTSRVSGNLPNFFIVSCKLPPSTYLMKRLINKKGLMFGLPLNGMGDALKDKVKILRGVLIVYELDNVGVIEVL